MLPAALATALRRSQARLAYLQPRHANPTGAVLSPDRRPRVLAALADAGAIAVEGDWTRDLDLDEPTPPPLAAQDTDGHIVYIRSLTKPVAAGLRIAALIAQGAALARLRAGRISDDLFVAPLLQQTALDVLTAPGWPRHLAGVRRALRLRRGALVAALRDQLPGCTLEAVPTGGVLLWLRLPDGVSDALLTERCRAAGLAVEPGNWCFPGEASAPFLRLSYAAADPPALLGAVGILAAQLVAAG